MTMRECLEQFHSSPDGYVILVDGEEVHKPLTILAEEWVASGAYKKQVKRWLDRPARIIQSQVDSEAEHEYLGTIVFTDVTPEERGYVVLGYYPRQGGVIPRWPLPQ